MATGDSSHSLLTIMHSLRLQLITSLLRHNQSRTRITADMMMTAHRIDALTDPFQTLAVTTISAMAWAV